MKLILLGAPGAGKGTIAKLLSEVDGSVQISTGDILRGAVDAGSALGARAHDFMQRGELAPDDLIMAIMEERLQQPDCRAGFLLDGFPRTIVQAEALTRLLSRLGVTLDFVVNLEVPRAVVLDRLSTRRTCENPDCQAIYNIRSKPPKVAGVCDRCGGAVVQRADESEEAITQRLETYMEKTAPLSEFYRARGMLLNVDATSSAKVVAAVQERLNPVLFWGVDGCRNGWFCIGLGAHDQCEYFAGRSIEKVAAHIRRRGAKIALIDIPIGLADGEAERLCDKFARKIVGPRSGSVFRIPCRHALDAYRAAEGNSTIKSRAGKAMNHEITGMRLSSFSWSLAPKIIEVDDFLAADRAARNLFREIHPELCFRAFKGEALHTAKKGGAGILERREILQAHFPQAEQVYENARYDPNVFRDPEIVIEEDDILDALAGAVTAKLGADADTPYRAFPSEPKDARGLLMQMLYVDPHGKICGD